MIGSRVMLLAAMAVLAGCGRKRPVTAPPPVAVDSVWSRAEAAFHRSDWSEAQKQLDLVAPLLPSAEPRYLKLHFYLAEIQFAQGNPLQAVREFRRVADERPDDPLAPDALVRAGDAYADLWRRAELDPTYGETAKTVYQEVLTRYDGTPAAARARLRLNELAEKFAAKEYKNALFYFKYKAYDSAILLFRSVIASYPRSAVVPQALERLVRTYQKLNYQEDIKETCAYIAQYHPSPTGPRRFCPTPAAASGEKP
jgi:outer membrane protein assembly factor BamD